MFAIFILLSVTHIHLCRPQTPPKSISQHSPWRASVGAGTLQHGTHLHTHVYTQRCTPSLSFTFTHTVTETHKHFHITFTHSQSSDSPHHCSLMSNLLHLCYFHLSLLTSPGNSIYPFYLYHHYVSPHSFLQPDLLPSAHFLTNVEKKM